MHGLRTVTEAASANLAQMLQQQDVPEDIAVRFVYKGQGIALHQDNERAGDTTFSARGPDGLAARRPGVGTTCRRHARFRGREAGAAASEGRRLASAMTPDEKTQLPALLEQAGN